MRISSSTRIGGRWILAAVLLGLVGLAACNEAMGTEQIPGAYPPEAEIVRPDNPPVGDGDGDMAGDGDGDMAGDGDGDADAAMGDAGMPDAG